jgi:hypothetical protein
VANFLSEKGSRWRAQVSQELLFQAFAQVADHLTLALCMGIIFLSFVFMKLRNIPPPFNPLQGIIQSSLLPIQVREEDGRSP